MPTGDYWHTPVTTDHEEVNTMKAYKGSKYAIVKDEYWADPSCCDHALCWKFHTKGCPEVRRVEWLILNIETGDRAFNGEAYELRRDAVSHLDYQLAQQAKEIAQ